MYYDGVLAAVEKLLPGTFSICFGELVRPKLGDSEEQTHGKKSFRY